MSLKAMLLSFLEDDEGEPRRSAEKDQFGAVAPDRKWTLGSGPTPARCAQVCSPGVTDGLGEEAQILVEIHSAVDLQDVVFFVLEESQGVPEDHLGSKHR